MGDETTIKKLGIKQIQLDPEIQIRDELKEETIEDYRIAMENGDIFPPLIVYHSRGNYYLADGFHRYNASLLLKKKPRFLDCEIREGTKRDAKFFAACEANTTHGLQFTRADKRNAVTLLLRDKKWSDWSDREIARQCKVSPSTVGKIRRELSVQTGQMGKRKVKRGETVYEQKISSDKRSKVKLDTSKKIPIRPQIEKKLNRICKQLGKEPEEVFELLVNEYLKNSKK